LYVGVQEIFAEVPDTTKLGIEIEVQTCLNFFSHSWDAYGIPGSMKVSSAHLHTSPRMSKAASDTDGVTYAPTTHKSLLYSSPYMHVEGVHDMEVFWIKEKCATINVLCMRE
jgi:hypothetical protein